MTIQSTNPTLARRLGRRYGALAALVEAQLGLLGVRTRDDRGAVSTEMAVVIAAMVAVALAAAVIFIAKAQSNANNIPDTVVVPTGG